MEKLSNSDVTLMENLCGVSQEILHEVLYKFLRANYQKVTFDKDFLVAEGDIPIALVAHMDTVFPNPATEVFYDRKKNVMWSPTGMGADDRAGIFAIIKLIKKGYRPHIIFTTDEEIGCIGAYELSFLPCPFKELNYIIQLDRRGANDCVFYDCENKDFEKYVESFGFVTAIGTFTDISEICPSWGIAGVNLSIGYRDEHSTSEILFVGHMIDTIKKVEKMLNEINIPKFEYVSSIKSYYYWDYPEYDPAYDYNFYPLHTNYQDKCYKCSNCGTMHRWEDVLPVKLIKGGSGFFCDKCMERKADFCWDCGEAYEYNGNEPTGGLCPDCRVKPNKKKFR